MHALSLSTSVNFGRKIYNTSSATELKYVLFNAWKKFVIDSYIESWRFYRSQSRVRHWLIHMSLGYFVEVKWEFVIDLYIDKQNAVFTTNLRFAINISLYNKRSLNACLSFDTGRHQTARKSCQNLVSLSYSGTWHMRMREKYIFTPDLFS